MEAGPPGNLASKHGPRPRERGGRNGRNSTGPVARGVGVVLMETTMNDDIIHALDSALDAVLRARALAGLPVEQPIPDEALEAALIGDSTYHRPQRGGMRRLVGNARLERRLLGEIFGERVGDVLAGVQRSRRTPLETERCARKDPHAPKIRAHLRGWAEELARGR